MTELIDGLILAVVERAVRDARSKDKYLSFRALQWLQGPGRSFLEFYGIEPDLAIRELTLTGHAQK